MINISNGSVRTHNLSDLNEDSRYIITVRAISTEESRMDTVIAFTYTYIMYTHSLTSGMF
jgi:hypothetical protein